MKILTSICSEKVDDHLSAQLLCGKKNLNRVSNNLLALQIMKRKLMNMMILIVNQIGNLINDGSCWLVYSIDSFYISAAVVCLLLVRLYVCFLNLIVFVLVCLFVCKFGCLPGCFYYFSFFACISPAIVDKKILFH